MNPHIKKLAGLAAAGLLLAATVATVIPKAQAANLTSGNYTYTLNGEEVSFTVDPVVRKDGLLLPLEVFQKLNFMIDGATTKNVTLKRTGVTVNLTVGSNTVIADGKPDTVNTVPLRLSGRLFLPADVLRFFGAEYVQDQNMVVLRDYSDQLPQVSNVDPSAYSGLQQGRIFSTSTRVDSGVYANGDFTLLTPELVKAGNTNLTYGARLKLLSLLQTNTLVMLHLSNVSYKSGAFVSSGVFLVDDQRNQYDLANVVDIGQGLITNKIAPGADRTGVLVFPKVNPAAVNLSIWYETQGQSLGTFTSTN